MAVLILSILLIVFASAHGYAAGEEDPRTSQWRPSEMDPSADKMIEGVELLPGTQNCGEPQCTFDLHYFYGGKEGKKNPTLKTIIFIPGGPGDIVDRANRDLWFLEGHFNVIYFNVRGTGRSLIPKSNRYDKFLRAEYIAADVEKIRQVEMRETAQDGTETVKPWDAIYAHSYGTVVAQIYASKYKDKNPMSKLILAAPIARNIYLDNGTDRGETEDARVNLIVSNLANIYAYHREEPCKKIEGASLSDADKNAIKELWTASVNGREEEFVKGTNDFCFVDPSLAQKLEKTLLDLINRYGSINFVTRYYDQIVAADPTFRTTYPPREFFVAVKNLQFTGAPSTNEFRTIMPLHNLALDADMSRFQVDAGLLIGYYLASDHHPGNPCNESAQFLAPLIPSGLVGIGPPSYKTMYCQRIDGAKTRFAEDGDGSKRAELVLGIQDGIVRWFFN